MRLAGAGAGGPPESVVTVVVGSGVVGAPVAKLGGAAAALRAEGAAGE